MPSKKKPFDGEAFEEQMRRENARRQIMRPVIGNIVRSPAFVHARNGPTVFGPMRGSLIACPPDTATSVDPTRATALYAVFRAVRHARHPGPYPVGVEPEGPKVPLWVVEAIRLDPLGGCPDPAKAERICFRMAADPKGERPPQEYWLLPSVELCGQAALFLKGLFTHHSYTSPVIHEVLGVSHATLFPA